jgi:proteasome lid subunit RPN8/RPN11
MTLVLEQRHVTAMCRHGEAEYPRESCGLIGGVHDGDRRVVQGLEPLRNTRTDSARTRYLIDPEAYRRAEARLAQDDLEVIGVYHSHPDHPAVPSPFDREHAWPRLSYVIVAVAQSRAADVKSWVLADDRTAFTEEPMTILEGKAAWQSQS